MKNFFLSISLTSSLFISLFAFSMNGQESTNESIMSDNVKKNAPKINFNETKWDFGKITQGEKVSHDFEFTNTGNADLMITSIQTSCGCTAVIPSSQNLKPSDKAVLKVNFDSSGRKDEQIKHIYVESNDPQEPRITLEIKSFIEVPPGPRIKFETETWDFGLVDQGFAPKKSFTIKNEGIKELLLSEIRGSYGCNATTKSDTIAPNTETTMEIAIDPLTTAGIVERFITFATNDTTQPRITIRILGYVKGTPPANMIIVPSTWDFGVVDKNKFEAKEMIFSIRNIGGQDLNIERINVPYGFETDLDKPVSIKPNKEFNFKIKVTKPDTPGTVKQYAFIYTNDPVQPTRRIDICGFVDQSNETK